MIKRLQAKKEEVRKISQQFTAISQHMRIGFLAICVAILLRSYPLPHVVIEIVFR
jgi:hypothetical protein